ncbi:MAG: sensor histidine kinase N-terminal domain-containing protein, partial [Rhodoferax sp.]
MRLQTTHSLRNRLLWVLLVAIMLTAVAQALISYRTARSEADDIFDYHMQQMALALRSGLPTNGATSVDGDANADENFDFVIQVWTADGLSVFQSAARAELPQRAVLGFSNVAARGTTYRVFSMQSRSQVIQVAQDMAARREMASRLALRSMLPIAV